MNTNVLGIIGTAGRGSDADKLSLAKFNEMKIAAGRFIKEHKFTRLVSGGAAYADHIAVQAYNAGFVSSLNLELPCEFNMDDVMFQVDNPSGPISNLYHQRFHFKTGINSLAEIKRAIEKGAVVRTGGGFHARNKVVAETASTLLAFTFGAGARLKDGGTSHCMGYFLGIKDKMQTWHCDLTTMQLYNPAEV